MLNVSNQNARSYSSVHPYLVFRYGSLTTNLTLVITGSGESGKSTIVKEMKIIHKEGFSDAELAEYRPIVYKNVLDSAQAVIIYMKKIGWDFVGYSNRVCFLSLLFPYLSLDAHINAVSSR